MVMATALPMPLLAPVIKKDRPATDMSTSFSIKRFDADSNAPLEQTQKELKKFFLKITTLQRLVHNCKPIEIIFHS